MKILFLVTAVVLAASGVLIAQAPGTRLKSSPEKKRSRRGACAWKISKGRRRRTTRP